MRVWLYVDMDAYYVSCELRERPELVGLPVIVGPDPKAGPTRGVVLSASYEARKFGVRSAMPAAQAGRLCPDAVWIRADFEKYGRTAKQIRQFLARFSPHVLPESIDEAAAAVEVEGPEAAGAVAREIQAGLRNELGLPASIGVATNLTVAKIACDRAKPAGIRVVEDEAIQAFLAPLPVSVVPGVGPRTTERLAALGVERMEQLLTAPRDRLRRKFGGFAEELLALARGEPRSHPDSETDRGPRSRSAATTFARDLVELRELKPELDGLADGLARGLEEERLRYQTVVVSLRWNDFSRSQRNRTLPAAHEDAESLRRTAGRLLEELWETEQQGARRRVRTMSVAVGRLSERRQRQRRLLEEALPGPSVKNASAVGESEPR